MAANVKIIMGRAGVGKTEYMLERIRENEAAGKRSVFIVSDRANFESEKRLSSVLGCGIINTFVVSFTSLARRALSESGNSRTFLSMQGRQMLLRRTITENEKRLGAFSRIAHMQGFTDECDELILKCKRFGIDPAMLSSAAENAALPAQLRSKLRDFALIYEKTAEAAENKYIDDEDIVNSLIDTLPLSAYRDCDYFIDTPETLNEQSVRIIEILFNTVRNVTVSFRGDTEEVCRDRRNFAPDTELYLRLRDIAWEAGCNIEFIPLSGNKRTEEPALRHLEKELFAHPYRIFSGDASSSIHLHIAPSRASEADACAENILSAVRSGLRFRDVGVIVGDAETYLPLLRRSFEDHNIPYFADAKRSLLTHPVSELMLSALACCSDNFRTDSFIRAIKTGLFAISPEKLELLENHLLKYGLSGSGITESFSQDELPEGIEEARETAAAPLLHLKAALYGTKDGQKAKVTASERVRALYDFLVEIDLPGTLEREYDEYILRGEFDAARESAQIFDTVCELLDQLHMILGDDSMGIERFSSVLSEGLRAYSIGIIPTTLDQVIIGSIDDASLTDKKYLLVLGMNEGLIPKVKSDNAVINDNELARLKAAGLPVWQSTDRMNRAENLRVYTAFSHCTERLYLSYCNDGSGDSGSVSPLFERVRRIFPTCKLTDGLVDPVRGSTERARFCELASAVRSGIDRGGIDEGAAEAYSYFAAKEEYSGILDAVGRACFDGNISGELTREEAAELYGRHLIGTPTRLETFNKCPYRYFLEFGLKIAPREEYEEKATDRGSFIHEALERFITALTDKKTDFAAVTDDDITEILSGMLREMAETHNKGIYLSSARMRAELTRLIELISTACRELVRQIAAGSFRPVGTEVSFGREGDILPALEIEASGATFRVCGIVDRLDAYKAPEGTDYIRIVDYKSSETKFDFTELASGIRLQLPLYAAAMEASLNTEDYLRGNSPETAGFYYQRIGAVDTDPGTLSEDDEKKLRSSIVSAFKLNGLTLSDEQVLHSIDREGSGFSSVVSSLRFLKDGTVTGNLASRDEMRYAKAFAKRTAAKTLDAIMQGRIEISPCRHDNEIACKYCNFQSVCAFDATSGDRYRHLRAVKADSFFNRDR